LVFSTDVVWDEIWTNNKVAVGDVLHRLPGTFCITQLWHWTLFHYLGGKLLSLGGSAWYLLAGLAYLLIAVGYLIRSRYVLPFAILTFLLTLAGRFMKCSSATGA
jgi:hypothetical protein